MRRAHFRVSRSAPGLFAPSNLGLISAAPNRRTRGFALLPKLAPDGEVVIDGLASLHDS